MEFFSRSLWYQWDRFASIWCQCSTFCVSFLLRLLCSLKYWSQSRENLCQSNLTKMKKWRKSTLIFEWFCSIFWNIFHRAVASPLPRVRNSILLDIPKPIIKCCRWCCRINIIVFIEVSVVLVFHKCLCFLRLRLYVLFLPRINNDLLSSLMFIILVS